MGKALKQNVVVLQGTTVIPLLTSVLLDKTQWETPDEFNPNHFLDSEGNFVKQKAFLPFSTGNKSVALHRALSAQSSTEHISQESGLPLTECLC